MPNPTRPQLGTRVLETTERYQRHRYVGRGQRLRLVPGNVIVRVKAVFQDLWSVSGYKGCSRQLSVNTRRLLITDANPKGGRCNPEAQSSYFLENPFHSQVSGAVRRRAISKSARRQGRTDLPNRRPILQVSEACFGGDAQLLDGRVQRWLHHRRRLWEQPLLAAILQEANAYE